MSSIPNLVYVKQKHVRLTNVKKCGSDTLGARERRMTEACAHSRIGHFAMRYAGHWRCYTVLSTTEYVRGPKTGRPGAEMWLVHMTAKASRAGTPIAR